MSSLTYEGMGGCTRTERGRDERREGVGKRVGLGRQSTRGGSKKTNRTSRLVGESGSTIGSDKVLPLWEF